MGGVCSEWLRYIAALLVTRATTDTHTKRRELAESGGCKAGADSTWAKFNDLINVFLLMAPVAHTN